MIYSDVFNGIKDARKFAKRYDGQTNGFSVKMTASGIGKRAQVEIVKTRDFFEHEKFKFNCYQHEISKIQDALKLFVYKNRLL